MQASCSICGKRTDKLWLETRRGRDYLVCSYDKRGGRREREKQTGEGTVSRVLQTGTSPGEHVLPNQEPQAV